jgi:hypothetical protein
MPSEASLAVIAGVLTACSIAPTRTRVTKHEAAGHLAMATSMYREMDMTYWLEQAEQEMTTFQRMRL